MAKIVDIDEIYTMIAINDVELDTEFNFANEDKKELKEKLISIAGVDYNIFVTYTFNFGLFFIANNIGEALQEGFKKYLNIDLSDWDEQWLGRDFLLEPDTDGKNGVTIDFDFDIITKILVKGGGIDEKKAKSLSRKFNNSKDIFVPSTDLKAREAYLIFEHKGKKYESYCSLYGLGILYDDVQKSILEAVKEFAKIVKRES